MCIPTSMLACGAGTHDDNGNCVADARFEIRATPIVRADGWTQTEVRVFGTAGDGSPSHDRVVVTLDRASAGAIASPTFVLDDRGGATNLVPCTSATAGCTGTARIAVALASAPMTELAHVDITLVAPPDIGAATPCLTGGNVLYFDSQGYAYDGQRTFHDDAFFDVFGADDRGVVHMVKNTAPSAAWSLEFNTHQLGIPLLASVYPSSKAPNVAKPGEPGFDLYGNGDLPTSCGIVSEFQILEFVHLASPDSVTLLTATFNVACDGQPDKKLTGCVHYAQ